MKLELLETFLTGHPAIDEDHRLIVKNINDVKTAIKNNNYEQCSVLLNDFVKACDSHFRCEERLLENLQYPDLESHIDFHRELTLKAKAVMVLCIDMRAPETIERCFDEMASLLIEDIIKGDMQFVSFLIEKGVVGSRKKEFPIVKRAKPIPKIPSDA